MNSGESYFAQDDLYVCQVCKVNEAKYEIEDVTYCDECISAKILEDGMSKDMILRGYYPFFTLWEINECSYKLIQITNDNNNEEKILEVALNLIGKRKEIIV